MRNLQPVGAGDKFAAIPKAYRRLKGKNVGCGCNGKAEPAQQVVNFFVLHEMRSKVFPNVFNNLTQFQGKFSMGVII